MSFTLELSEEFKERMDGHLEEGETYEEFLEELLNHYESEGESLWEGYGGAP